MPGEENGIGKNTMILYNAIMADMGRGHKQVAVTNPGCPRPLGSTPVHSNSLAKGVAITYIDTGRLTTVAEILGRTADHRAGMDHVLDTEDCGPLENCVFTDAAVGPDSNRWADNSPGRDLNSLAEPGLFMDPPALELPVAGNFFSCRIRHSSFLNIS